MKKLLLPLLMICCFSCSNPTKTELLDYINNKISVASGWEIKAVRAYEAVSGANYKNDSIMYVEFQISVIPNYSKFCAELKKYEEELKEPELIALHKTYIEGANLQLKGFGLIQTALEKHDTLLIAQANSCLEKGRFLIKEWRSGLDSMCKNYEIVISKN